MLKNSMINNDILSFEEKSLQREQNKYSDSYGFKKMQLTFSTRMRFIDGTQSTLLSDAMSTNTLSTASKKVMHKNMTREETEKSQINTQIQRIFTENHRINTVINNNTEEEQRNNELIQQELQILKSKKNVSEELMRHQETAINTLHKEIETQQETIKKVQIQQNYIIGTVETQKVALETMTDEILRKLFRDMRLERIRRGLR